LHGQNDQNEQAEKLHAPSVVNGGARGWQGLLRAWPFLESRL
jgi:hypothetical protein